MLVEAFSRFVEASKVTLTTQDYLSSAEPEFRALVDDVANTLPRYRNEAAKWDSDSRRAVRHALAHNHLAGFLSRIGFERAVREGGDDASQIARDFEREAAREDCRLTQVLVLNGLEVCSDEAVRFSRGELVRISNEMLKDVKGEHGLRPSVLDRVVGLYGLKLDWTAPNPPWGSGALEELGPPPRKRIQTMGHPWATYVNLWGRGKTRVAGVYERTDSLLVRYGERYVGIDEPVWEDHYAHREGSDTEEWVSEAPVRYVSVNEPDRFVRFIERLESGRVGVQTESHRCDIALRYFGRIASAYWEHHLRGDGLDIDGNEDILVDGVTALETLLLAGEKRDKGRILAQQLAALLHDDPQERRATRRTVERIYKVRSAVLHGDSRSDPQALSQCAIEVEQLTRLALTAFVLLHGDRASIARGARDELVAQANRDRVRFS